MSKVVLERTERWTGLRESNFEPLAVNGFGDPYNSYAHAMIWFQNRLYVGTTRANLCLRKRNDPPALRPWPVYCPPDMYDLDLRGRIWAFDPARNQWTEVQVAPWIRGNDGLLVPRDLGYRAFAIVQGRSDRDPALYVTSWGPGSKGGRGLMLRSADGIEFERVSSPGLGYLDTVAFRSLIAFNDRLYTSPSGRPFGRPNVAETPVVLESDDPARGGWRLVSAPGFGDPSNLAVLEMAVFNGHLYAGTLNPSAGYQIWKTAAAGPRPYHWTKVVDRGAYRGALNEAVISMYVFRGALYVGSAIQGGGHDRGFKIGPAPAELIRIHPDDSWDLVVGHRRNTPVGSKWPLSGLGAGFENFFTAYIWRLCEHDGWLYAGTYDWSVFLPYITLDKVPAASLSQLRRVGIDNVIKREGGFDLWRSADGVQWSCVTRTGFGNAHNVGLRTMASSPAGLFLGTANPFGPHVAVKRDEKWVYVKNPQGGLEIWRGRSDIWVEELAPDDGLAIKAVGSIRPHLNGQSPTMGDINRFYDQVMYGRVHRQLYGESYFTNFGYWTRQTRTLPEACESLVERLLAFIPEKRGTILDVACGVGGTTRHLLKYYRPESVVGINISEKQLETCRRVAPGCSFYLMDATDLEFPDQSFRNIICVEAAFHFGTREAFLHEAHRVLKPGGRVVLSDILSEPWAQPVLGHPANYVEGLAEYEELYRRAGFTRVQVIDATRECAEGFSRYYLRFLSEQRRRGGLTPAQYRALLRNRLLRLQGTRAYVLVSASRA